ncbi:MAG TPA: hypothetical protein VK982_10320 [Bacteroidales bacterium]|nr:hypothetical protein [Bacteroidales bacterium]
MELLLIILTAIPWIYILHIWIKRYIKKRKRVKEFDKMVTGVINTMQSVFDDYRDLFEIWKYVRYQKYQNKIRQNTRFE